MKIGIIGLGKMGANIAENLMEHAVDVTGFDLNEAARDQAAKKGIAVAASLDELLESLPEKKIIWLMDPSGKATQQSIQSLSERLKENDILIDAGNSNYKDSMRDAKMLNQKGIRFLDVGTSGGTSGARNGACLMIGGDADAFEELKEVFESMAVKDGCMYTGKAGSGHFMKMVHNGIEYGMMEAIAEGFQVMKESDFDYNLEDVAKNWNHGSVIRSWLMELAQTQFQKHPDLEDIKGVVAASGEAKWTVEAALDLEVPVPIIALSLMARNRSQEEDSFACKVLSALRNGFGGHEIVTKN